MADLRESAQYDEELSAGMGDIHAQATTVKGNRELLMLYFQLGERSRG